jgi:predicted phosphoadenosine phosphosulfate sulfurtransferase
MTFEDFVVAYGSWFRGAIFVGLRATESYDRFLGTFSRLKMVERSQAIPESRVFCPLYDWRAEDIWTYNARFAKLYNPLYDRMHQAGISVHRMRVCEPYGNEQKQGLWLFHIIEPEMWSKVCARVAGANSGALYSGEKGNMTGTKLTLPPGHTWKSFTMFLLETMPKQASEHYKNKIAVYLKWYRDHDVPELPDSLPKDTGAKDVGTWRRICSTLLKHDYWAIRLGFAPNKTSAYAKYQELMKKRREQWAII